MKLTKKNLTPTTVFLFGIFTVVLASSFNRQTPEVYIDSEMETIQFDRISVEILNVNLLDEKSGINVGLNESSGNYELLILSDGVTDILTDKSIVPAGELTKIQLELGVNNYRIDNGEKFPLNFTPYNSSLKISLNAIVNEQGEVETVFDFNADKLIRVIGPDSQEDVIVVF